MNWNKEIYETKNIIRFTVNKCFYRQQTAFVLIDDDERQLNSM